MKKLNTKAVIIKANTNNNKLYFYSSNELFLLQKIKIIENKDIIYFLQLNDKLLDLNKDLNFIINCQFINYINS